jgi:hypothetical protein
VRAAIASELPAWVAALPADDSARVQGIVMAVTAELEHLEPRGRMRLVSACLAAYESGARHSLDLLDLVPPALRLIRAVDVGGGGGDDGDNSSQQQAAHDTQQEQQQQQGQQPCDAHRDTALHRLMHAEWRPEHVGGLLKVAREIGLTPAQAREAVRKAVSVARCVHWLGLEGGHRACRASNLPPCQLA